jgi:signal transduction histidine kinase
MRASTWIAPTAVATVGVLAAAGLAVGQAMSSKDVAELLEDSMLGSAAIGALAIVVLVLIRRVRLGVQIAVAAVAPVAAVGVGVVWATSSMFLTGHDESIVWVVLVSAGTMGIVCALVLGRGLALASREVGLLAKLVDDPPTVARYFRTIRMEADRLSSLVDDLFELSRLEAGTARLDLTVTALGDVVADAVDAAAAAARTGLVELCCKQPELPILATIDVSAISRVVGNLVDNAIRHTLVGGTVAVRTAAESEVASVTVTDACGGIPEADLGRVFEAGYRGDLARTPGLAGGGFGLAIARGLVEAHHGQITVGNVEGGCCFEVRLPAPVTEFRSGETARRPWG